MISFSIAGQLALSVIDQSVFRVFDATGHLPGSGWLGPPGPGR